MIELEKALEARSKKINKVEKVKMTKNPQEALDSERFSVSIENDTLFVENSFNPDVVAALKLKGHSVSINSGFDRGLFGGGQIIVRDNDEGVLFGGSDPRKDGLSVSF